MGSPQPLWESQCAVPMEEVVEAGVRSLVVEGEIHNPEEEMESLRWIGDTDFASPVEPGAD